MHEDFISSVGWPFIAHRLKRLSDRLVAEIAMVLEDQQLTVPATAGSTLVLLSRHDRLGVMEIAERLRMTHPFIVRLVSRLEALDLVCVNNDPHDLRRKWVELTEKGALEASVLGRLNTAIENVFTNMAASSGDDLLEGVTRLEGELAAAPLSARLRNQLSTGEPTCA